MDDLSSSEEFVFKALGSEGDGDESSRESVEIELFEPEGAKADGAYLFILPNVSFGRQDLEVFLNEESKLRSRVAILKNKVPEGSLVISFSKLLIHELERLGLRRITIISEGDGANLGQALCLLDPKLFRRAVLIDPRSRMHPTLVEKLIDKIESYLPVGLPFRALTKGFNSRPFLHRIRMPILILISSAANMFSKSESEYIGSKVPNSYLINLKESFSKVNFFSDEFLKHLLEFQNTPPKRPQKNR